MARTLQDAQIRLAALPGEIVTARSAEVSAYSNFRSA